MKAIKGSSILLKDKGILAFNEPILSPLRSKKKFLRRLEALMSVADKKHSFIISGTGDVLEPEDGIIGIGSGGNYALASGKVLIATEMSAEQVAEKAIEVAAEICVFTNNNVKIEKI